MKKITVMRFFTAILCISAFVTFVRPVRAEISKADAARRQMEASMQIGDFRQALSKGIEAERLYEEEGQVADRIRVYIQLSTSYQNLGQHEKGLEDLKIALDLTKKAGDDALEASVLSHLGNAYMLINRLDEAEVRLKEALGIAERQGDDSTKAAALNYSGNLHMLRKDYDKAAAAYREAMAVPEGPANRLLPALVSANYAEALLQGGEYEAAARAIRTSYAKLKDLANSHDKAYGLIHLAQTCRRLSTASSTFRSELGQLTVASLNKAASVSEDIDDHLAASYALGYLGQFYEVKGLYADAINFTRRAIFEVQQIDAPEALYRWQWQSGRLFRAKGDLDAAISSYRDAVRSLQSVRRELFADCRIYNGLSFETEVEPVYYQLADLLLKRSEPVEDHETVQRYYAEAQRTVELLNTAELQNYFQDACLTANSATMTDLGSLPPHSAVIYVIPLADRIELLLGLPTEIRRFTAKVDEATVAKEVRILRKRLEKRTTRQYLPHAQKVYDWLIRPLETELASRKIDTLVFVLHGAFRTVPMAALHDGRDFLIRKFAVVTSPGLSLTDPRRPLRTGNEEVLLAGLTKPVQGFPALTNVPMELKSIEALYRSRLLKDSDFRISTIKGELQRYPYPIVHIASHGEFFDNSKDTYILTWDEKLSMDDLEKIIGISRFRKEPVEVLTLSACVTAAGDDRASLGLAGVGVKAGARSALATLWYINDHTTYQLVTDFYDQLRNTSVSKAKALQHAQIKLLDDRHFRHPGYWSPFLLIGNWL